MLSGFKYTHDLISLRCIWGFSVFPSLASRSSQGEEEWFSCMRDSTLSFSGVGVHCIGFKLHISVFSLHSCIFHKESNG